jgi:alpha-glucoside transport system permease protein
MKEFLAWLAGLPALVQVPIVIGAFLAGVAVLLVVIEFAPRAGRRYFVLRLALCVLAPSLGYLVFGSIWWAALVGAVIGAVFFIVDYKSRRGAGYFFQLVAFLAPAIVLLLIGLVYPIISTTIAAFLNNRGKAFVGLENFQWVFDPNGPGIRVVINTVIWVLVVPIVSTVIGLAYAAFIERSRGERFFKILVFMPMAISFVGASIIFKFVYDARPAGQPQIGLLNEIVTLFGGQPVFWLQNSPWNTFFLIVVLIWVQTGFAMVVLSAAIKGVPTEQLEAAELDGTNAWQRFMNVTVPGIRSSLIVVLTTISIASLKVFDIVRTMTAGTNQTSVIANEMYSQFKGFEFGRSSALAVVLFILVLPIVIYNARQIKKQREIR